MTLGYNEIYEIRVEILEVQLVSLKARYKVADEYRQNNGVFSAECKLLNAQIKALEKDLKETVSKIIDHGVRRLLCVI